MSSKQMTVATTDAIWIWPGALLKSIRTRPVAWLMSIWLVGWGLYAWHLLHTSSWETVWGTLHNTVQSSQAGRGEQTGITWLHELARWGQMGLYISSAVMALYVGFSLWVWRRYYRDLMPAIREERFQSGCVLEVIMPTSSKADARATADMLGQLWNLLSGLSRSAVVGPRSSRASGIGSIGNVEAERLALSLEMWATPHNDGKVSFYVWCPSPGHTQREDRKGQESNHRLIEEVRHLIMVHHPRCRVRWVEDPLEQALAQSRQADRAVKASVAIDGGDGSGMVDEAGAPGIAVVWYELSLLADSRYPIGSGASDERLFPASRSANRPGSPGAGSDPLAVVVGMLGSDEEVTVIGIQIVVAARAETAGQTQQAVNQELTRLREIETQAGKKALGPQHEARVLALEEKADRQGYDVVIRLVAAETPLAKGPTGKAEARLTSLLRVFTQYDRVVAGVNQGFRVARRRQTMLSNSQALQASVLSQPSKSSVAKSLPSQITSVPATRNQASGSREWLRQAAPVLGRWPREGVCLPRMLPFMRTGRPCILNMAELSAIYHFPHQGLEGLSTLRWGSYKHMPPPAYARVTAAHLADGQRFALGGLDEDLAPSYAPDGTQPPDIMRVGTYPQDLRRGTYVLGPMGSGKSVFLYNAIVQFMSTGRGVGLIDGKGDSYEEVLRLVPPDLEGKVLTFDPENRRRGRSGAAGRSIGINPIDGHIVAQLGAEKVESLTMGLMKKMMGSSWDQAVLMQRFLRDALLAVLEAEPSPTMLNLWRWLQDDGKGGNEYRAEMVGRIRNHLVKDFWQNQVRSMNSQQRSSMQNVLTRVDRYIKNDVRHVILQPYSTVNFRELMDGGTIFVGRVSPRLGEDQAFLGALLLNGFLMGAFSRQAIPQEQRRDYLLVVDEFQNFVDTARADVERMLSMARGYRLGLMLAHQFTEQLPREVLSAILKNAQTWVLFGLQADDARLFAGYMEGLKAEDFQNLPAYYTYQRTVVGNKPTGVYSARPLPPPSPAANPGEVSREARREVEKARDAMRAVNASDDIMRLVHGMAAESEDARRTRLLTLAKELYWTAEEGDPVAVETLSRLNSYDVELYRRARRLVLDRQERERILACPWLVPDKGQRIERLSSLRWGTPCVETEALIRAALRKSEEDVTNTRDRSDVRPGAPDVVRLPVPYGEIRVHENAGTTDVSAYLGGFGKLPQDAGS